MPTKSSRFLAVLLLVIPGGLATYGFALMRESVMSALGPPPFSWWTFLGGLGLFCGGVAFIGGWIFYRDRKRNYVAPRFRKKRKRPPSQPPSPPSNEGRVAEGTTTTPQSSKPS